MTVAGSVLLALAVALALGAALAWVGAARSGSNPPLVRAGRWAVGTATAAVLGAVVLLEVALLRHDTTVTYVAKVSGPDLPAYYRVTALWSALEGSLLLWLLVLSVVAVVFLRWPGRVGEQTRDVAGACLCMLVAAFGVVSLVSSPFTVPAEEVAARPSPLLQDHVAMGVHPPLLYAGFAALAVPYALSLGGVLARAVDQRWADVVHGWSLVAWVLLSLGIGLGAWWSYAVLGWGGYWAWDPVENASLLPWLTTTALLHAVGRRTRGPGWRAWSVVLAGTSFLLVLLATFLTRSGVVESIHAFTTSPLGPALLVVLLLALLPWLAAVLTRRADLRGGAPTGVLSRPAALHANRVLLVLVTAIVLVGTVLPSVLLAVTGDRVSVGPPWYERTLAPVALVVLLLMAVGPWLRHRGEPLPRLLRRLQVPAAAGAVTLGGAGLLWADLWLALVAGIAAFVLASMLAAGHRRDRRGVGALLAHLGVALGAVAVLAGGHGTVTQQTLGVGDTLTVQGTTVTLVDLKGFDDGRRSVAQAEVLLGRDGQLVGTLRPELRWYETESAMLAGPQIRTEPFRDVYLTLLDVEPGAGVATLRLAVTPLVGWLWAAGGLMVVGAVVSGWPGRRRGTSTDAPDRDAGRQAPKEPAGSTS